MDIDGYRPFIKPVLLIAGGVMFLSFALYLVLQSGVFSAPKVEIIDEANSTPVTSTASVSEITVEIAGSVAKPGVYKLPGGARVQDALTLAGDVLSSADKTFVERSINRAAKLTDGQKIYIPEKGETAPAPVLGVQSNNAQSSSSLISINSASESELDTLPGVGPATSAKIIKGRPYGSLEELLSKKSVSSKVYTDIKDKISL